MISIDALNIPNASCGSSGPDKNLFKLVNDDLAFRWENIGEGTQTAVPYGWRFVARPAAATTTSTTTMSTSRETQKAVESSLGVNSKVNVFFVSVASKVNVAAKQMSDDLKSSKATITRSDYIATQSAFVIDKTNVALSDEFQDAVQALKADARNIVPATRAFEKFVDDWGTHYSAATTYGARGHFTFKMTEDDVMKVVENGIDVNVSVKVGAKMDGVGASTEVATGLKVDETDKVKSSLVKIDHSSDCQGGGACHNGEPSDNARVAPIMLDLRPISELLAPPFTRDVEILTTLHDGVADEIARRTLFEGDDDPSARFLKLSMRFASDVPGASSTLNDLKQGGKSLRNLSSDPSRPVFLTRATESGPPALVLTTSWILPNWSFVTAQNENVSVGCEGAGMFGPEVSGSNAEGPVTQTTVPAMNGTTLMARGPACGSARDAYGNWVFDVQSISGSEALNLVRN